MTRLLAILLLIVFVGGCASGRVVQISDAPVTGPKVIALDAPSAP